MNDVGKYFVYPINDALSHASAQPFGIYFVNKIGDTIPIVARKLLRTQMPLHRLSESRIDTSHLSAQSERPLN